MPNTLQTRLEQKMAQSFSERWDPGLDLEWGLEPEDPAQQDSLSGTLYIEAIDDKDVRKRIHSLKGQAKTIEELDDWVAELLSIVLEKHPVWRLSKVRKQ